MDSEQGLLNSPLMSLLDNNRNLHEMLRFEHNMVAKSGRTLGIRTPENAKKRHFTQECCVRSVCMCSEYEYSCRRPDGAPPTDQTRTARPTAFSEKRICAVKVKRAKRLQWCGCSLRQDDHLSRWSVHQVQSNVCWNSFPSAHQTGAFLVTSHAHHETWKLQRSNDICSNVSTVVSLVRQKLFSPSSFVFHVFAEYS